MSIEPLLPDEITVDDEIMLRPVFNTAPEALHSLVHRNLAHLGPYMFWARPGYALGDVKEFQEAGQRRWNESGEHGFSIFHNGELAGLLGIRGFESAYRAVSIGYWLSEHLQGRGIMTRSVAALIKLAFEIYDMNQVIIRAAPDNTRSRAIPERLGFTNMGMERQVSASATGELLDLVNYSLLKSEWNRHL